ncbi:MAG: cell division protein FtsZ [Nitrospirae bacterium]|nr:cell division protein FtsZ [Nitrospirota bacterium]
MNFQLDETKNHQAKIKVIGVGGAGGNALNTMIRGNLKEVEFIAVNTDMQVLETSLAPVKLQIGQNITRGLGAGSEPMVGRESAHEDIDRIRDCIEGSDMVFITAGMGGGTGTGAAPVIAELAHEAGILTVGVVTKPFFYEGKKRLANAMAGIKELNKHVDTIIIIPNDRIQLVVEKGTSLLKSFELANDVLKNAVQGITDLILVPGLINLDFADVKSIMKGSGKAVMGLGTGVGEEGVLEAAKKAISIPLLEDNTIEGARGILVNITGGETLSLDSIQNATGLIYDSAHNDANIIFGVSMDAEMKDEVRITVIATSFEEKKEKIPAAEMNKWRPETVNEPVKRAPVEDKVPSYRSRSERFLTKESFANLYEKDSRAAERNILGCEDEVDIPTFSRKPVGSKI